jgi:haloalkane dehalogenase
MSTTKYSVTDNPSAAMIETTLRPQWLDEHLYPFQSRFVEIDGNRVHYIDEGTGPILLLLHAGIGWSFTYRDVIKGLRSHFRCVALDLPGFGLSEAAPGYQHTLTGNSLLVERFIQALEFTDITFFGQDLTGSIGLGVVGRHPELFRAVILGPSFAWPLEGYPRIYNFVKLVGSPVFRFLGVNFNFFLRYYLRNVTRKPDEKLSAEEKMAYLGPMSERAVRRYPHDLYKSLVKSHDYLVDLNQRLLSLKEIPALFIFGDQDGLIKIGWLSRFEQIFPRHRTIVMKGAHHFPQEYDPTGVVTAIRAWWDEEIEQ